MLARPSYFKRILCELFHHKYYKIKKLSLTTTKLGCSRCGKQFAMNSDVRCVLPWTDSLQALHEFLGNTDEQSNGKETPIRAPSDNAGRDDCA